MTPRPIVFTGTGLLMTAAILAGWWYLVVGLFVIYVAWMCARGTTRGRMQ